MCPGVVDQMHIIDPGRAGRHAREARKTTVHMGDHLIGRRPIVLQHIPDQIDPATRTVELITQQDISRASGGAKSAMYAIAQDLLAMGYSLIGQLLFVETSLHAFT